MIQAWAQDCQGEGRRGGEGSHIDLFNIVALSYLLKRGVATVQVMGRTRVFQGEYVFPAMQRLAHSRDA